MMIKNKPRNASSRASRGFFTTGAGTPAGPALLRLFTTKLHDNGIPNESTPFDSDRWTILVVALAFPAMGGLDRRMGTG
jgi:hypothetical protein